MLEVALQATIYAGMPRSLRFIGILERVLEEQGRGGELEKLRPALDAFKYPLVPSCGLCGRRDGSRW